MAATQKKSDWKRPDRRRVRAIRDRLRKAYGRPILRAHRAPVDELILTVLSQNTNDRNRDVAYGRLRERFSSWDDVRDASEDEVEEPLSELDEEPFEDEADEPFFDPLLSVL